MIIAGDIGGTKTNLGIYKVIDGVLELQAQSQYSSKDYSTFIEIISVFMKENSMPLIKSACFGVAGPVIDGRCKTTNLPWDIKTLELQNHLKTQNVNLLNDVEATAYGMLYLKDDEFVDLNPEGSVVNANRCVIAAGTGLGEAILYFNGNKYHPIGSEGGHTDFAPLTEQQDELLKWLRNHYPKHVSYERILSGAGIFALYEFLLESGYAPQPAKMLNIEEGRDKSAMISECALEDNDPLCVETLLLFSEIYGAEAGNLALKSMSLGGVYIGGGIAPKILPILKHESFLNAFVSKGRFEEMLRSMAIKISLNQETALLGAAHFAMDRFLEN
ncbi:glucokinase [Sulfurimonas aquatica]|uniref:Glucokinase n=1 Tax=Sulfurimonas aquatica TaxID=2672570 RepID=A0A975GCP8_9BACT|nr:glucokinase [Sulfurimonas aquatica]QSZ41931.1 glucokinase [Sulfurimonas aquatica]